MLGLRRVAFSSLFRARLVAQHPLARHDCRAPEPLPSPAHSPQSPLFPTELARACALPASPSRDLRIEFAPQAAGLTEQTSYLFFSVAAHSNLRAHVGVAGRRNPGPVCMGRHGCVCCRAAPSRPLRCRDLCCWHAPHSLLSDSLAMFPAWA